MNDNSMAAIIRESRKRIGLTQTQLADRLKVTKYAVSKWERGLSMPDISLLRPLAAALDVKLDDLLSGHSDDEKREFLSSLSLNWKETTAEDIIMTTNNMTLSIDTENTVELSPYIFGHNLEHTRSAVGSGLSAQMLRNRKFAGKPHKNSGVPAEWEPIGDRAFYNMHMRPAYTRHIGCEKMWRGNELSSLSIQNLYGRICGIKQNDLCVKCGEGYILRAVTSVSEPVTLTAAITSADGSRIYAEKSVELIAGDWQTSEFTLTPTESDDNAAVSFTYTEPVELVFGALSMLPEDNFHGMRSDVLECLKQINPTIIRWPGGNFAGEYRWKDGLLPSDMRGPLQAATEIETQPHSHGYDFHEISTDDFVALCREVGAEPFITINPVWNSVEDSADWVEYCNGGTDTEYGAKRAENGHPEPYNVRFWSLGNEMGYGHMEGPMNAADYAVLAGRHAEAMTNKSPDISLFSSGPYPNDEWAEKSAAALKPYSDFVSLHHYSSATLDFSTPEKIKETYGSIVSSVFPAKKLIADMRESLDKFDPEIHISFDEWNFWYAWYRPSCVAEGIFAARMLHMLIAETGRYDAPVCCYFQPVNEGAVIVNPDSAELTANGQMFAMMKPHHGGRLCRVTGDDDYSSAATVKDGILTVTLVNAGYDEAKSYTFKAGGKVLGCRLYSSDSVIPYTRFDESDLEITEDGGDISVSLPPHSAARITVRID